MDIGWNFRREHLRIQERLALRHHQRRRSTQRRPAERVGLVLLPRDQLRGDQEALGHRRQDGAGRGDDDRHHGDEHSPRIGLAGHFNKTIAETMYANIEKVGLPAVDRRDQKLAKSLQHELKVPEVGMATKLQPLRGRELIPDEREAGGGSDDIGDISWNVPTVTLRYPSNMAAGPGHNWANAISMASADRAQGNSGGRQGRRADGRSISDEARAHDAGLGLFPQRADENDEIHAADSAGDKPAIWLNEQIDGQIQAGNEEVLLRSDEVQELPGTARDQLPDSSSVG
jgi:aminobenzoyl-glutamate utilization protein B